jgi:hypothetical protein
MDRSMELQAEMFTLLKGLSEEQRNKFEQEHLYRLPADMVTQATEPRASFSERAIWLVEELLELTPDEQRGFSEALGQVLEIRNHLTDPEALLTTAPEKAVTPVLGLDRSRLRAWLEEHPAK